MDSVARFCHINQLIIKNPKILLVSPVLKPDVYLHDFPVSCPIILCNWQDRKEQLGFQIPWPVVPRPWDLSWLTAAFLFRPQQCLPGKPVEGNNQWAVQNWEVSLSCPLAGSQGLNTPPYGLDLVSILGPPVLLKGNHQWLLPFFKSYLGRLWCGW